MTKKKAWSVEDAVYGDDCYIYMSMDEEGLTPDQAEEAAAQLVAAAKYAREKMVLKAKQEAELKELLAKHKHALGKLKDVHDASDQTDSQ